MKADKFFENFESLTDAPNAVSKLREIILQLAVRGKLVQQDFGSEPASLLYEKLERVKNALPLELEKMPFAIPDSWKWVRFGEIFDIQGGSQPPKSQFIDEPKEGYVRLFQIRDFGNNPVPTYIHKNAVSKFCTVNDVMLARYGASVGKVFMGQEGAYNVALAKIIFNQNYLFNRFVFLLVQTPLFQNYLRGMSRSAQAGFNKGDIYPIPLPLPPTIEQKRIVEKCDHLLSFCNQIEVKQRKRQESIVRMNESAIAQLLSSQNSDEFSQHWEGICNNFDLLYSIPETIPKLRQAILQLAVQGKLVRQEPSDETASALLERIATEKKRLIEEGRIKNALLPVIKGDDTPYKVPNTWSWARFGEVILNMEAGVSPLCEKRPKNNQEWGVIKISAVSWDKFDSDENKALPVGVEPRKNFEIKVGDFLISRANTSQLVGKSVVVEDTPPQLLLNDKTLRVFFSIFSDKRFFNIYNNSFIARNYYAEQGTGTSYSMKNITREQIRNIPIPIPPLAEQKRIVAKVDCLMSLCDTLEAKLKDSRSHSELLMEVAAKQLLTV